MGFFFQKKATSPAEEPSKADPKDEPPKKSLYQRFQGSKRGELTDEDIAKYTGKSRAELNAWAETQPGVGKNQLAGKLSAGPTTGLGGMAAADGFGGWGPSAEGKGDNRGMKFPPEEGGK